MSNPLPLDAAARDELRAKAEAARAATQAWREATHEENERCSDAMWAADAELSDACTPETILALLAAVEQGAEDTVRIEWLEEHSWRMDNDGAETGPREHPMLYVGMDRKFPPITAHTVRAAIDTASAVGTARPMTLREAFDSVREENEGAAKWLRAARAATASEAES